jgi:hypothetical protein
LQVVREGLVKYSKFDLIEGMHYYLEGNKVVFTELFHKQRGYCCGAGCKHCPFDPKHNKGNKKTKKV